MRWLMAILALSTSLTAGCSDLLASADEDLTVRDSGRADLAGGDWLSPGFEMFHDGGHANIKVEATGSGVDVAIIHYEDYQSWVDGDDEIVHYCWVVETRLFEQTCPLDKGRYVLTIWNSFESRSVVDWSLSIPPVEA